jgi:hypothetical protein
MMMNSLDQEYLRERRADLLLEAERERRLRATPGARPRLAPTLAVLGLLALVATAAAFAWF